MGSRCSPLAQKDCGGSARSSRVAPTGPRDGPIDAPAEKASGKGPPAIAVVWQAEFGVWTQVQAAVRDIETALRYFRRNRGFFAFSVVNLALGIAATTSALGVAETLFCSPHHPIRTAMPGGAAKRQRKGRAAGGPSSILVSDSVAKRHWKGRKPLGRRVSFGEGPGDWQITVVGIAEDVRYAGPEKDPTVDIYSPLGGCSRNRPSH